MQKPGRKQRSIVDNLIILISIIENQRQNKNKTNLFFADATFLFLRNCDWNIV